jgi:hypothetical protein
LTFSPQIPGPVFRPQALGPFPALRAPTQRTSSRGGGTRRADGQSPPALQQRTYTPYFST